MASSSNFSHTALRICSPESPMADGSSVFLQPLIYNHTLSLRQVFRFLTYKLYLPFTQTRKSYGFELPLTWPVSVCNWENVERHSGKSQTEVQILSLQVTTWSCPYHLFFQRLFPQQQPAPPPTKNNKNKNKKQSCRIVLGEGEQMREIGTELKPEQEPALGTPALRVVRADHGSLRSLDHRARGARSHRWCP